MTFSVPITDPYGAFALAVAVIILPVAAAGYLARALSTFRRI